MYFQQHFFFFLSTLERLPSSLRFAFGLNESKPSTFNAPLVFPIFVGNSMLVAPLSWLCMIPRIKWLKNSCGNSCVVYDKKYRY